MRKRLFAAMLALCFALRAFAEGIPDLGDAARVELTPQMERAYAAEVLRQLRFNEPSYVNDPEIEDYLDRLGAKLVAVSQAPNERYRYFALRDPSINAAAIVGGVLVFNAGLFAAAQSESEVASVMAHEISHIQQRHQARMIAQQGNLGYAMVATLLLALLASRSSADATGAALVAGQAAVQSASLAYSRDYEREADRMGLQILGAAGFDTRGMVAFFERLERATHSFDNAAFKYLMSHPLTTERIGDMSNRVMQENYRQHIDSVDFVLVKTKLEALTQLPREMLERFAGEPPQRPLASAVHWYARARANLALKQVDAATRDYQQLRALPLASPMIEGLGAELASARGEHEAALKLLREARGRYPQSAALLYQHVDALLATRQAAEAGTLVQRHLSADASDDRLWRRAAQVAVAQGKRLAQHRAQAEVYFLQGALGQAVDQLQLGLRAGDGDYYEKSAAEARLAQLRELRQQARRAKQGR